MTVFFNLNDRIDDYLSLMAFLQYYHKNNIKIVSLNHNKKDENKLLSIFSACKILKPNLYVDKESDISFASSINESIFKGDLYVMCDITLLNQYIPFINNSFSKVFYFSDKPLLKQDSTNINEEETNILKSINNITLIPCNVTKNFSFSNPIIVDLLKKLINKVNELEFFNAIKKEGYLNHLSCFIYSFFSDAFEIASKKIKVNDSGYIIFKEGFEIKLCNDIHKADPSIMFMFEQFFQRNKRAGNADRINIPNRYNILIFKNQLSDMVNIEECGWEKRLPNQSFSTITRNWYSLHVISKGYGRIIHDDMIENFSKGDIFILKPNHFYQYISDENNPCEYYWICMSGSALKYYIENSTNKNDVTRKVNNSNKLIDAIKAIVNSHESEESFVFYTKSQLYKILTLLIDEKESNNETSIVSGIKQYISDNFARGIKVNDICEYFTYDRSYLFRLFKSETGKSISEYINDYKIEAVKNYLLNTTYTLDKICVKTGFNSRISLINFCKANFGLSPTQLRKQQNNTK